LPIAEGLIADLLRKVYWGGTIAEKARTSDPSAINLQQSSLGRMAD
jgi:hypothetical protein